MQGISKLFSAATAFIAVLIQSAVAHPLGSYEPVDSIPYRLEYQGWITVNATVNGDGPNDFIVDSGATITSVFGNLAARQSFEPADRRPIRILGLASAERLPAYRLGEITVGRSRLQNHVGVILPDWQPPRTTPQGVLGLDLLTRYTVMINADEGAVNLYPRGSARPESKTPGWTSTELKSMTVSDQITPLYRVNVNVRGLNIPCIVDLGASGTVFNGSAFRKMTSGVRINRPGLRSPSGASRLDDIFDTTSKAINVRIKSLRIGRAKWKDRVYLVYDAQIFKELGAAAKPFCLVGADLLADRSIIFDFEGNQLFIGPEAD